MGRENERNWKTRALAWILSAGVVFTSLPQNTLYAAEFESEDFTENSFSQWEDGSSFEDGNTGTGGLTDESGGTDASYFEQNYQSAWFRIIWSDGHDAAGSRPQDMTELVHIYGDGALVDPGTYTIREEETQDWQGDAADSRDYIVDSLPVYREDTGERISYIVDLDETGLEGCQAMTEEALGNIAPSLLERLAAPYDTLALDQTDENGALTSGKYFGIFDPAAQLTGEELPGEGDMLPSGQTEDLSSVPAENGTDATEELFTEDTELTDTSAPEEGAEAVPTAAPEEEVNPTAEPEGEVTPTAEPEGETAPTVSPEDELTVPTEEEPVPEGSGEDAFGAEITDDMAQLKLNLGSSWYLAEDGSMVPLEEADDGVDFQAIPQELLNQENGMLTGGFSVLYRLLLNGADRTVHAGDWFTVQLPSWMENLRLTENGQQCRGGYEDALLDGVIYEIDAENHLLKVTFTEAIDAEEATDVHGVVGLTFDLSTEVLTQEAVVDTVRLQSENECHVYLPAKTAEEPEEDEEETEALSVSAESDREAREETQGVTFSASKQWQDNNKVTRPAATWTLYRKTEGSEEYEVVTYDGTNPVTWTLRTSLANQKFNENNKVEILSTSMPEEVPEGTLITLPDGGSVQLPETDKTTGKTYVYAAKETMNGTTEELYHSYIEGNESETKDQGWISNDDTLLNRLEDTIPGESEDIVWVAEQYKDVLSQITVEMTLQSRIAAVDEKGAPLYEWEDVITAEGKTYTKEVTGFGPGKMQQTVTSGELPKYNDEGQELEYRWVETAIIQDGSRQAVSLKEAEKEGEATFQLSQNKAASETELGGGEQDHEHFVAHIVPSGQPYAGRIINTLKGTTSFHAEKQWDKEITETEKGNSVTVSLYQRDSVGRTVKSWDHITISKEDEWKLNIAKIPDGNGEYTEERLPKYDSNGARYRYEIVEEESGTWEATYARDEAAEKKGINQGVTITNKKRDEEEHDVEFKGSAEASIIWRDAVEKDHTIKNLPVQLRYKLGDGRWIVIGEDECTYDAQNNRWEINFNNAHRAALGITDAKAKYYITEDGDNKLNRTLSINGLPSMLEKEDGSPVGIQWDIRLDYDSGTTYTGIDDPETKYIIEQQLPEGETVVQPGSRVYHMTPTMDFSINLDVRKGDDPLGVTERQYFEYYTTLSVNGKHYQYIKDITQDYPTAKAEWKWDEKSNTAVLTVTGLPWCDENKADLDIYAFYNREIMDQVVDDYKSAYDNSEVPNYGNCVEHVHDGGTLKLVRTDTADYSATKVWMDSVDTQRPETVWTLWRYTAKDGGSIESAAPVRDDSGSVVQWILSTSTVAKEENEANPSEVVSIQSDPSKGNRTEPVNGYKNVSDLPKYDSDGYEYIYFVSEEMFGSTDYVQHLGKWVEDSGEFVNTSGNNNVLVNEGTLTNRPEATVTVSQKKTWIAANYQTDIEHVAVEMTLQSRLADGGDWGNMVKENKEAYTKIMDGFKTEAMTQAVTSEDMPKYDSQGRLLEYRWVETGVYENGVNLLNPDTHQFTLAINDKASSEGEEYFVSEQSDEEDGLIVNRLVGVTDYYVEKTWQDGLEPGDIKVTLVQQDAAGNQLKKWEHITVPYKEGETQSLLIDKIPDKNGKLTDIPLPKYDENGGKYIYIAYEERSSEKYEGVHEYNLTEDNNEYLNGYNNVRINNVKPGPSKWINVRKQWLDDEDSEQRLPVTVEVGRVKGNEETGETETKVITTAVITEQDDWWKRVEVTEYKYERDGKTVISPDVPGDWSSDSKKDNSQGQYTDLDEWKADHVFDIENEVDNDDEWAYYVREIGLGLDDNGQVKYSVGKELSEGGYYTVTTGKDGFKYEVMYPVNAFEETVGETHVPAGGGIDSEGYYTVRNRRTGTVNLTVTKTWLDGGKSAEDRKKMGAVLELRCEEYQDPGVIGDESGTSNGYVMLPAVLLDGKNSPEDRIYPSYHYSIQNNEGAPVSYRQTIGNADEDTNTETVYFWNLPKYDASGRMVHYTVLETGEKLKEENYQITVKTGYSVQPDVSHTLDLQVVTVTNKRESAADVHFYKRWIDQNVFINGDRPDIYLSLYRAVKNGDGTIKAPEKMSWEPRKWDKASGDSNYYWTCTFENMPRYDDNGAEYVYYAAENVSADAEVLDYIGVQYAYRNEDADSAGNGGENGTADSDYTGPELTYLTKVSYDEQKKGYTVEYEEKDSWVRLAVDQEYVLQESGVFVNQIRKNISIQGKKVWENVPVGFPASELPNLTFDLYRSVGAEEESKTKIAEIRNVESSDMSFNFTFLHEGINDINGNYLDSLETEAGQQENTATVTPEYLLQKYDPKTGALYSYTLKEVVENSDNLKETAYVQLGDMAANSYMITNTYQIDKENQSSVTVKKNWEDLPDGFDKFPEIEFDLYRFYERTEADDSENFYSKPELVDSKKITSSSPDDITAEFDKLLVLAPNNNPYIYYVQEKTVNGYKTEVSAPVGVTTVTKKFNKNGWPEALGGDEEDGKKQPGFSEAFQLSAPVSGGEEEGGQKEGSISYTNTYQYPEIHTVQLQGTKIWDDYSNKLGTRPPLKLSVYRWAENQSAQGNNAIGSESEPCFIGSVTVPVNVEDDVTVTWDGDDADSWYKNLYSHDVTCTITYPNKNNKDNWTYTFTNLDRYAPNGNPWIYKVVETYDAKGEVPYLEDNEGTAIQTNADKDLTEEDKTLKLRNLTNRIKRIKLDAYKKWNMLEDFQRPTVTFALQVKEGQNGTWRWAADYFKDIDKNNIIFTTEAHYTGIDKDVDGSGSAKGTLDYAQFEVLPVGTGSGNGYKNLYYRVCEVKIGETSVQFKPGIDNKTILYPENEESDPVSFPGTEYAVTQSGLYYTIQGQDGPTAYENGNQTYVITNTPKDGLTSLKVEKKWENDADNGFKTRKEVWFGLYRKLDSQKENLENDKVMNASDPNKQWTFSLSTAGGWVKELKDLPKYGYDDSNQKIEYIYYVKELDGKDGKPITDGKAADNQAYIVTQGTSVKVTPTPNPNGETAGGDNSDNWSFTQNVTNTLRTTKLEVTKAWTNDLTDFRPDDLAWGTDIYLYRSTIAEKLLAEKISDKPGNGVENVTSFVSGDSAPISTVKWNKNDPQQNTWTLTIAGLPQCNEKGEPYYYAVKEKTQSGYLTPLESETTIDPSADSDQNDSADDKNPAATTAQKMSLMNNATEFRLEKLGDEEQPKRLNDVELTFEGDPSEGSKTKGWKLVWKRNTDGIESYTVTVPAQGTTSEKKYGEKKETSDTSVTIKGLPMGTYILTGEKVPLGYETAVGKNISITLEAEKITEGYKTKVTFTAADSKDVAVDESQNPNPVIKITDHRQMLTLKKVDSRSTEKDPLNDVNDNFMSFSIEGTFAVKNDGKTKAEEGVRYLNMAPSGGAILQAGELIATKKDATSETGDYYLYTLKEVIAPKGYVPLAKDVKLTFTMDEDGNVVPVNFDKNNGEYKEIASASGSEITLKNDPISILLKKTDTEDPANRLSGAQFRLEKWDNDEQKYRSVAGADGIEKIITVGEETLYGPDWELECGGHYQLVETKAPAGYILDTTPVKFWIKPDGEIAVDNNQSEHAVISGSVNESTKKIENSITVSNAPIDITLTKVDVGYDTNGDGIGDEQGQSFQGVSFTLTEKNDSSKVQTKTTNDHGILKFGPAVQEKDPYFDHTFVVAGGTTYVLKETVPTGYTGIGKAGIEITVTVEGAIQITNTAQDVVQVGSNNTSLTVKNTREKGSLTVTKKNGDTNEVLDGVVLKLTKKDVSGSEQKRTTGADGIAKWENLEWGTYTLEEVSTKDGYICYLPDSQKTITIDGTKENQLHLQRVVQNYKNELTVWKKDSVTNAVLEAEFALYKAKTDGSVYDETASVTEFKKITDNSGTYYRAEGLPAGKYKLVETTAPKGYILPANNSIELTVNVDGSITAFDTGSFTVEGNTEKGQYGVYHNVITMKDNKICAELIKTDQNGNRLNGAIFEVKGEFAGTTATTIKLPRNESYVLDGELIGGKTYTITEISAPAGYQKPETAEGKTHFTMTVDVNGTITVRNSGDADNLKLNGTTIEVSDQTVSVKDTPFLFTLKKVEKDSKEPIKDITFTLTREAGKKFANNSTSLTLVSNENGELQCRKDAGSFYTNEEFMKLLYAGETYTLREETAAASPYIALDDTVTFTIGEDGKLSVPQKGEKGFNEAAELSDDSLILSIANEKTSFKIKKIDNEEENGLAGAQLELYPVSNWDENNHRPAENSTPVRKWTSATTQKEITGLATGEYVLYERKAPAGYCTFAPIHFKLNEKYEIQILPPDTERVGDDQEIQLKKDDEKVFTITVTDTKIRGHVELKKTLAGGAGLAGAEFDLYQVVGIEDEVPGVSEDGDTADTRLVKGLTTDIDGTWKSQKVDSLKDGLPEGTYYFVETKAPANAHLDTTKHSFDITADRHGKTVSVSVSNDPFSTTITLKKIDSTDGAEIEGAVFNFYYSADGKTFEENAYRTLTTEKNDPDSNKVTLDKKGFYKIVEESNYGYNPDFKAVLEIEDKDYGKTLDLSSADVSSRLKGDGVQQFSGRIDTVNGVTGIINERLTGTVSLTKADSQETEKYLKDVQFKLQKKIDGVYTDIKDGNQQIIYYRTDDSGELSISGLEWGEYKLIEHKAAPGYVNDGTELPFIINRDSQDVVVETATIDGKELVLNRQNQLTIRKESAAHDILPGAEFEILDKDKQSLNPPVTGTAENGTLVIKGQLTGGEQYYLHETTAPDGYELPDASADILFTMEENGKVKIGDIEQSDPTIIVTDTEITLTLKKVDEKGDPINSPATFALYKGTKDSLIRTNIQTGADGTIILNKALLGQELVAGATYILSEEKAPDGYETAEDITFVLNNKGKIETLNGNSVEGEDQTDVLTVTDKQISLSMSKENLEGTPIAAERGIAKFTVTGTFTDGNKTVDVTSNDMSKLTGKLIAGSEYTMTETEAPKGYMVLEDSFTFVLDKKGTIEKINGIPVSGTAGDTALVGAIVNTDKLIVRDTPIDFTLVKKASDKNDVLNGAVFEVSGEFATAKSPITVKVTDAGSDFPDGELIAGKTYTITETTAPLGYKLAQDVTFKVADDGRSVSVVSGPGVESSDMAVTIEITDEPIAITIFKVNEEDPSKTLSGAEFTVAPATEKDRFAVSEAESITVTDAAPDALKGELIPGSTYVITEITAPDGYELAEKVTFTVGEDGTVKDVTGPGTAVNGDTVGIKIADTPIKAKLVKADADDKDHKLAGAVFALYEGAGDKKTLIAGCQALTTAGIDGSVEIPAGVLVQGKTYTLAETKAPEGYQLPDEKPSVTFTVGTDGKLDLTSDAVFDVDNDTSDGVSVITVKNTKTKLLIQKISNETGEKISGAALQLLDAKGEVVDSWESKDSSAKALEGLAAGTYTLHEAHTPDGYTTAEDITFTLKENNTLEGQTSTDSNAISGPADGIYTVTMTDTLIRGHVKLHKTLGTDKADLKGAVFSLYRVNGTEDAEPGEEEDQADTLIAEGLTTGESGIWISRESTAVREDKDAKADGSKETLAAGLEKGTYYLVETAVPNTVKLDTETKWSFAIGDKDHNAAVEVKAENTPFKAAITAKKTEDEKHGYAPIKGAVFDLYYSETEPATVKDRLYESGIVSGEDGVIKAENLIKGCYLLKETGNVGYDSDSFFEGTFQIQEEDYDQTIDLAAGKGITNTRNLGSMTLKKVDGEDPSKELKDVVFKLQRKDTPEGTYTDVEGLTELKTGTVYTIEPDGRIVTRDADSEGTLKVENLDWGFYKITETAAIPGYENHGISLEFTIEREKDKNIHLKSDGHDIYNEQNYVDIRKVDAAAKNVVLPGAEFEVLSDEGETLKPQVTARAVDGTVRIKGQLTGGRDYILRETKAPDGYELAEDISFRVAENGEVRVNGVKAEDRLIQVEDQAIEVTLRKAEFAEGEKTGALIQSSPAFFSLYEGEGAARTLVKADISTGADGKVVLNRDSLGVLLKKGITYTLVETKAPAGYELAGEVTFTVDENGAVTVTGATKTDEETITVEDKKITLSMDKQDLGGTSIDAKHHGAVFKVAGVFADDSTSITVTSDDMSKLTGKLVAGNTYRMEEITAPEGYELTDPFEFTVGQNGEITVVAAEKVSVDPEDSSKLVVKDAPIQVDLTKTDLGGSASIEAGRGLAVFEVTGRFAGETAEETIPGITSANIGDELKGKLIAGESYTFKETAAPAGYELAEEFTVTVDKAGKVSSTADRVTASGERITVEDAPIEVSLVKVDGEDPSKTLPGAEFTVAPATEKDRFAVSEAESITVTDAAPDALKGELIPGSTYVITEITAPDGYELAEKVTFTVGEDGTVKDVTGPGTAVNGDTVGIKIADTPIKAKLVKADADDKDHKLAGAVFALYEGAGDKKTLIAGCQALTTAGIDGSVEIPAGVLVQSKTYTLAETKAPEGYQLPDEKPLVTFTVQENGTVVFDTKHDQISGDGTDTITVEDFKTKLTVAKISNENGGEPVSGAGLQILKGGKAVREWQTGGEPVVLEGLAPGRYTLHEADSAAGYLLAEDIPFILHEDNSITAVNDGDASKITADKNGNYTITMTDVYIRGQVELQKTLGNAEPLEGAVFSLYKADASGEEDVLLAAGLTTDEDGIWTTVSSETIRQDNGETLGTGLEKGSYYFLETETVPGAYLDSTAKYPFEVTEENHGEVQVVKVDNPLFTAELILKKIDAADQAPVSDVTFKVSYDTEADGSFETEAGTIVTDEDGLGTFSFEKKGFYKLAETDAVGYDTENGFTAVLEVRNEDAGRTIDLRTGSGRDHLNVLQGTITADGIENTRLTGSVALVKADRITGEELKGVTFQLQKKEEASGIFAPVEELKNLLTGNSYQAVEDLNGTELAERGRLEISGLDWGTYKLVETKAAEGYENNGVELVFTIDRFHREETVYTDIVEGKKLVLNQKNFVELHKVDKDTGRLLKNAVFEIYQAKADRTADSTKLITTVTAADGTARIEGILTGGVTYVLHEKTAPSGYKLAEDIVFTMEEDGSVTADGRTLADHLIIVEDEAEVKEPSKGGNGTVPGSGSSGGGSAVSTGSTSSGKTAPVKTGDDTNSMPYILLLFLSGGGLMILVIRRRKRDLDQRA